ncbi:uncharacterized protein LOC125758596 [Rhipicephalus sanguineus]|uniref:Transmembrane protein n=1 Tax=Rhipicephalus sanguineus TaxID=34632 RepID=A0A9D4PQQ0_RHISA|nr:uncharacterized protein LOC125758596 [Rhipicephalus sanguineus]KAH7950761.1 hypothetical protein HPB52_001420 [Rhipicephalus sanguineus]
MSNRSTSTSSTTKQRKKHTLSASGEAAGGEPEGELKPQSRDVPPQPGKDSTESSSSESSDSGGRVVSRKTALGDRQSTAEVDFKSELLDANIHDFTSSDQSSSAASKRRSSGARKDSWRPGSSSHGTDAAGSLSEYSNDVDTLTHATTQAFTAVPAASSTAMLVAHEEHEPKHESFLKTIAKASFSVSSFSFNEPLAQVSIAFFSMCLLFVIVACSVIVYSCGVGACSEAGDPASNGTPEAAARAHRKTDVSKSGHLYMP